MPMPALTLLAALALHAAPQQTAHSFAVVGDHFELDGKPFVVRSGEMHYPRVPRAYWRDRFRKAKAMGLNTICTYTFWNLHEPQPGKFDFRDNLDLAAYLKIAQEEGLYIILRPGPYICTELDFGGLPGWLQKGRTMTVRSRDPKFLAATQRYFNEVARVAKPYLIENGGPVLMTQVENEYGSYGDDHVYVGAVRDALRKAGFGGQLFTSDGPGQGMLNGGTLPGIPATVNFGGGGPSAMAELDKFRPGGPKMVGEYWCGWFDHWGERHHRTNAANHAKDLEWFLKNNVSFNLYMFHGGTSFAFMPGANGDKNNYQPDITSYDYDSPLDESGRITPKYTLFRDTIARVTGEKLPPIPDTPPTMALPPITLKMTGGLVGGATKRVRSEHPLCFEDLGQNYGMAMYATEVHKPGRHRLSFDRLNDYAMVYVNGQQVGNLDRRFQQRSIEVDLPEKAVIDVIVEGHARINFGRALADEREGIDGKVYLDGEPVTRWMNHSFPLETAPVGQLSGFGPAVYTASVNVARPGDTFLDLGNWTKGYVWVNGHNLGRFWTAAGPQRTLYLPGVWLRKGLNQITLLDEGPIPNKSTLITLDHPIIDVRPTGGIKPIRKAGQTVRVANLPFTAFGTWERDAKWQTTSFSGGGRYLAVQVLSEHTGGPYASAAEFEVLGEDGKAIQNVKVVYADSEEIDNENGSANNLFDHQPDTIWHTQWGEAQPGQPHLLVFDLGKAQGVTGLRYLPRHDGPNGRIKDYRIFLSPTPFPGQ